MIPLTATILSGLKVAELALIAFNGLPEPLRVRIVTKALDRSDKAEAFFGSFGNNFNSFIDRIKNDSVL